MKSALSDGHQTHILMSGVKGPEGGGGEKNTVVIKDFCCQYVRKVFTRSVAAEESFD